MDFGDSRSTTVRKCAHRPGRTLSAVVRLGVAVAVFPAFAAAVPAAPSIEIAWPDRPGVLSTGQQVQVRWSRLDPGVEEAELLLVVGSGSGFTLRLTRELEPGVGSHTWTVPNLPARAARVCLRAGIEGREIQLARSAAFRIVPALNEPPPPIRFSRGEWWAGAVCSDASLPFESAPLVQRAEADNFVRDAVLAGCPAAAAVAVPVTLSVPSFVRDKGSLGDRQPSGSRLSRFVPLRE
jgi:hypothetical protein